MKIRKKFKNQSYQLVLEFTVMITFMIFFISAQTGSGKTLAFGLPILQKMSQNFEYAEKFSSGCRRIQF